MPHLSKRKIKAEIAETLSDQLLSFLVAARTKGDARVLAEELLTQTERLMLAKRLAVVVMLTRGYSFEQIEEALVVGPQMIARIWKEMKDGRYQKIVRYARDYTAHFKQVSFWSTLEKALAMGLPPRAGRGRWKFLNKSLEG